MIPSRRQPANASLTSTPLTNDRRSLVDNNSLTSKLLVNARRLYRQRIFDKRVALEGKAERAALAQTMAKCTAMLVEKPLTDERCFRESEECVVTAADLALANKRRHHEAVKQAAALTE
jgi:hypothetical protein